MTFITQLLLILLYKLFNDIFYRINLLLCCIHYILYILQVLNILHIYIHYFNIFNNIYLVLAT